MGQEVAFILLITLSVVIVFQIFISKYEIRKTLSSVRQDIADIRRKLENK